MADTNVVLTPITVSIRFKALPVNTTGLGGTGTVVVTQPKDTWVRLSPIVVTTSITSDGPLNCGIQLTPITVTVSMAGGADAGVTVSLSPITITLSLDINAQMVGSSPDYNSNWVWWSDIGSLDFTFNTKNVAGKRPMPWKGGVYHLVKLGASVIAYGSNGVFQMSPSGVHWGGNLIYDIGVINKGAVVGNDDQHFFIDKFSRLIRISSNKGLERLDYSEYLSVLTTPILSWDSQQSLLFISDATHGYVYDAIYNSMGETCGGITGVGNKDGTYRVVSPASFVPKPFSVASDVYDFGTRKMKGIDYVEVGSDISQNLYVALDYRRSYKLPFLSTPWFLVNPNGTAYCKVDGVEFRVKVRATQWEDFEVDYVKVRGHVHDYSYLSTVQGLNT